MYTYRQLKTFINTLSDDDLDKEAMLCDTTDPDDVVFEPIVEAVLDVNDFELAEELKLIDYPCLVTSR